MYPGGSGDAASPSAERIAPTTPPFLGGDDAAAPAGPVDGVGVASRAPAAAADASSRRDAGAAAAAAAADDDDDDRRRASVPPPILTRRAARATQDQCGGLGEEQWRAGAGGGGDNNHAAEPRVSECDETDRRSGPGRVADAKWHWDFARLKSFWKKSQQKQTCAGLADSNSAQSLGWIVPRSDLTIELIRALSDQLLLGLAGWPVWDWTAGAAAVVLPPHSLYDNATVARRALRLRRPSDGRVAYRPAPVPIHHSSSQPLFL